MTSEAGVWFSICKTSPHRPMKQSLLTGFKGKEGFKVVSGEGSVYKYMTNVGMNKLTKVLSVRIRLELWEEFKKEAKKRFISIGDVAREKLEAKEQANDKL